ncbi:MAG: DNA methyltransferase [Candidatus Nanoarchaeia archaeon]
MLFFLSKENITLAKAELDAFLGEDTERIENLCFAPSKRKNLDRLAMTRTAGKLLFTSPIDKLKKNAENFSWKVTNFCVKTVRLDKTYIDKKIIAGIIHRRTGKPAQMKNPEALIEIFLHNNTAYVTKRVWENTDNLEERKNHKRPAPHPTSLHPKLAKALVNLTGIKRGRIIDPFCGGGGLLIEAGLMGLKCTGYDISQKMLEKCRKNLTYYNIKDFKLLQKDALQLEKSRYILTDLPYGKSSTANELNNLYGEFLEVLANKLLKRAVVVFPSFYNYKSPIKKAGLKITKKFSWYIHKSMTRNIIVIETGQ